MRGEKAAKPRPKPARRQRRQHRQRHHPATWIGDQRHAGALDHIERPRHVALVTQRRIRRDQLLALPREQLPAQLRLERLDQPAHGALGQVQVFRRRGHRAAPYHGFEREQLALRRQETALTHNIHSLHDLMKQ